MYENKAKNDIKKFYLKNEEILQKTEQENSKILPLWSASFTRKRNFKRILFFFALFLYISYINCDKLSMNIKGA